MRFQEGKVTIRGAGEPQKVADSAIEAVFTQFHQSNPKFWEEVRHYARFSVLGKRTLVATARFAEHDDGGHGPVEGLPDPLQEMKVRVGRQHGVFNATLMAAFGAQVTFGQELMQAVVEPHLVQTVYGYSFNTRDASLLQSQLGQRGRELHTLTQIHEFFHPPTGQRGAGSSADRLDNFMMHYCLAFSPSEQVEADLRQAFHIVGAVSEAMKSGTVKDADTGLQGFGSAAVRLDKALRDLTRNSRPAERTGALAAAVADTQELVANLRLFGNLYGRGK